MARDDSPMAAVEYGAAPQGFSDRDAIYVNMMPSFQRRQEPQGRAVESSIVAPALSGFGTLEDSGASSSQSMAEAPESSARIDWALLMDMTNPMDSADAGTSSTTFSSTTTQPSADAEIASKIGMTDAIGAAQASTAFSSVLSLLDKSAMSVVAETNPIPLPPSPNLLSMPSSTKRSTAASRAAAGAGALGKPGKAKSSAKARATGAFGVDLLGGGDRDGAIAAAASASAAGGSAASAAGRAGKRGGGSKSAKRVEEGRGLCRVCGRDMGAIFLHGKDSEFDAPYVADVVCRACHDPQQGGLAVPATPGGTAGPDAPAAVAARPPPVGSAAFTASVRNSRRFLYRAGGPHKPIRCDACHGRFGYGGVRLLGTSDSDLAPWIDPAFQVEYICKNCHDNFRVCTDCGSGGKFRTGKWRPVEFFSEGRVCNLHHIRLGKEYSPVSITFRIPNLRNGDDPSDWDLEPVVFDAAMQPRTDFPDFYPRAGGGNLESILVDMNSLTSYDSFERMTARTLSLFGDSFEQFLELNRNTLATIKKFMRGEGNASRGGGGGGDAAAPPQRRQQQQQQLQPPEQPSGPADAGGGSGSDDDEARHGRRYLALMLVPYRDHTTSHRAPRREAATVIAGHLQVPFPPLLYPIPRSDDATVPPGSGGGEDSGGGGVVTAASVAGAVTGLGLLPMSATASSSSSSAVVAPPAPAATPHLLINFSCVQWFVAGRHVKMRPSMGFSGKSLHSNRLNEGWIRRIELDLERHPGWPAPIHIWLYGQTDGTHSEPIGRFKPLPLYARMHGLSLDACRRMLVEDVAVFDETAYSQRLEVYVLLWADRRYTYTSEIDA
ncbi:hypothetical protein HK405_007295 [Cladochytrium tenue]|nr:hypothetical protein HK405_007295 [Cladochytrium tenue]